MNRSDKSIIITGRANSGKTLFILNFAEYMGYKNLTIKYKTPSDEYFKDNSISYFKNTTVSSHENFTKCLQFIPIDIPVIKGRKKIVFIDSTGLSSNINFDQSIREGMAQTLTAIGENHIIFHMVDAFSAAVNKKIDDVDMELYLYGKKRGNYLVLANKIDLKESEAGIQIIENNFTDIKIIKISALCKTGFGEVKKYVTRLHYPAFWLDSRWAGKKV